LGTHQQNLLCIEIDFCCCPKGFLAIRIFQGRLLSPNFHNSGVVRYCWILQLTLNFKWCCLMFRTMCSIHIFKLMFWGWLVCNILLCCLCQISPIQSLVGRKGRRWVMGVISQLEDGHFYLEDLSASVEINLTDAISFYALIKLFYFVLWTP